MRQVVRISLVCLTSTVIFVMLVSSEAGAGARIKAGQHFVGLVNGSQGGPVVKTICAGPSSIGHVAGKQTMSVVHVPAGHGYTGLFSGIHAWLRPATSGTKPTQIYFKTFSTPVAIPTSIEVPCGGTGTIVFSSCPYLAPCAFGWVTYSISVKFESLGV